MARPAGVRPRARQTRRVCRRIRGESADSPVNSMRAVQHEVCTPRALERRPGPNAQVARILTTCTPAAFETCVTLIAALRTRGRQREDAGHAAASSIALVGRVRTRSRGALRGHRAGAEPAWAGPQQCRAGAVGDPRGLGSRLRSSRPLAGLAHAADLALGHPVGDLAGRRGAGARQPAECPPHVGAAGPRLRRVSADGERRHLVGRRPHRDALPRPGPARCWRHWSSWTSSASARCAVGSSAFRPFVAHVGNQVRASGVFQYPTIASMYLEVLFALSLPVFASMVDRRRPAGLLLASIAIIAMTQATVLTFTRAGVVTMLASLAVVVAIRYRARGADRVVAWLSAVALAHRHPVRGVGPRQSPSASIDHRRDRGVVRGGHRRAGASGDSDRENAAGADSPSPTPVG